MKKSKLADKYKNMSASDRKRVIISIVSIAVFIAVLALIFILAAEPLIRFISEPDIFRDWVDSHGIWGRLAFIGMVVLQIIVAVIPGEPFEIAAGYAFGTFEGTFLCLIGIAIGSIAVFLFVKYFGYKAVEVFFPREKINSVRFLRAGKKLNTLAFILFLIPGTPKDIMTYCVGLTDMKLSTWLFISIVARIPSVITSTIGGDALGVQKYEFAIIVFAVTITISLIGLFFYNKINCKNDSKKEEKMKYLSVDVGGTFVKYGIVNESGCVLKKGKIPTPQSGFDEFVDKVSDVINAEKGNYDAVSFSTLGHPEPDSGYVRGFSSLPYVRDKNFKEAFFKSCGVKIEIENDANCAALAESWKGIGKGVSGLVCIILGTSIGGGIVKDGYLHKGLRIGACETSGMMVGYSDGHYESLQMTTAMSSVLNDVSSALGKKPEDISGEWVFDKALENDPICAPRVERYMRGLAMIIHNIIYFYDPDVVAIGGGISQRPELLSTVRAMLDEMASQIDMEPVSHLVKCCEFNNDANLIGAARHAMLRADKEWSYTLD